MKSISKNLNLVLFFSILGIALSTWMAPKIISILFTPPISFGINCEPAAAWSMQKLVVSQLIGFISGLIAGIVFVVYLHKWILRWRGNNLEEITGKKTN